MEYVPVGLQLNVGICLESLYSYLRISVLNLTDDCKARKSEIIARMAVCDFSVSQNKESDIFEAKAVSGTRYIRLCRQK